MDNVPLGVEEVIATLLYQYKDDINTALLSRYFYLAALVILVVDLAASHAEERRLIWTTPRSWAKCAFLANRYFVPLFVTLAFVPVSGFIGAVFSPDQCKAFATAICFFGVCSMGISNALVVMWVMNLWDNLPTVTVFLIGSAAAVWVTSAVTIVVALQTKAAFEWNTILNTCLVTQGSPLAIVTWAGPLVFELLVLGALVWNALDRPRSAQTPLGRALRADGATYFAIVAVLRAVQVACVATGRPLWFLLPNPIVWALVTVTTNRALFALRRAEEAGVAEPRRAQSPFGLSVMYSVDDSECSWHRHTMPDDHRRTLCDDRRHTTDERRHTLPDDRKLYRLSDPLPPSIRFPPIDLMRVIEVDATHR